MRIGGSDAFLVPTVPMKTTLKEDSTDDYYGKLSLVNAGRGVLNAPDVDVCGCYLSIALFQLIHIVDLIIIIIIVVV